MPTRSLLERLEELINVDVDDVNTEVIKLVPFTPHNRASNCALSADIKPSHRDARVLSPENQPLLEELVNKYGKEGWERVYDMAAVALCARNVPYLSGRVLLQVSLRHLNDREAIIKQCRSFAEGFKGAGVPRDRFAIKLPFSGSAASAAAQLNAEGIRTLATTVFSLEQAIAASQSNCLFISPYYNEIAAHLDPSLRPNVSDPALEHPMSARVIHILDTFAKAYAETGEEQPIMIIASHFNTAEILAMAELGCQHITIQAHNLKALLETPDTLPPVTKKKPDHPYAEFTIPERLKTLANLDPLSGEDWDGVLATTRTDYVVNGGAQLDQFIQGNAVVKKRLQDAEKLFLDAEEKAGAAIRQLMAAKGL
ncbi:hypothetical protein ABEF92_005178 [Exophiala dermatitidis]|uniref:Transaldolase n=1 Tax=Exophiala dermatitidis (strain ATCC 34100 / CBS 525.76 / NIH/UT8656) TaxID=858893 RepID=H6BKE3_EXODN|nr:transaldolase [Exophiala dermatitidis NIH/UT8656]EHY52577.1 transaldolase [Exophiala dermatitidis NIH/UT8656]